jgi:hypothetical protein
MVVYSNKAFITSFFPFTFRAAFYICHYSKPLQLNILFFSFTKYFCAKATLSAWILQPLSWLWFFP